MFDIRRRTGVFRTKLIGTSTSSGLALLRQRLNNVNRENAVGGLSWKGFHHHPTSMFSGVRSIHEIDGCLPVSNSSILITSGKVEPQSGQRFPGRFKLGTLNLGVEVQVDRGSINDLRDLIIFVVVVEY